MSDHDGICDAEDRAKAWVDGDPTAPALTAHGGVCVEDQTLRSPDQLDNLVALLLHLRGQMSWSAPEDAENARATADPDLTAHGYVSVPEQSLRSPDQLDSLVARLLHLRGQMSWPASEDEGGALPPPGRLDERLRRSPGGGEGADPGPT